MAKGKRLSKKQLSVIEDLFIGQLDEQAILDKHEVSRAVFVKWQMERRFVEEFNRRIAALNRQGELIIARYAPLAAAKLVGLTESQSQETARKACIDIIEFPKQTVKKADEPAGPLGAGKNDKSAVQKELPPETASRLLAALVDKRY
ncbi:MAG: hypothetical protein NTW55_02660 [Planctomycetota bacterium]|nr:hypothetical protein [Planctomycetota bacterium]